MERSDSRYCATEYIERLSGTSIIPARVSLPFLNPIIFYRTYREYADVDSHPRMPPQAWADPSVLAQWRQLQHAEHAITTYSFVLPPCQQLRFSPSLSPPSVVLALQVWARRTDEAFSQHAAGTASQGPRVQHRLDLGFGSPSCSTGKVFFPTVLFELSLFPLYFWQL